MDLFLNHSWPEMLRGRDIWGGMTVDGKAGGSKMSDAA